MTAFEKLNENYDPSGAEETILLQDTDTAKDTNDTGLPDLQKDGKNVDSKVRISDDDIEIETEKREPLIYRVSQRPPVHLMILFALQQSLISIVAPLTISVIVFEVVCAQHDMWIQTQILSASLFMVGLSTFCMSTFGVRLPVFQGPALTYLIPIIGMQSLPEWKCPETQLAFNSTVTMAVVGNGTLVPARDMIIEKITKLSGSMLLTGGLHFLIGLTGFVGIVTRYVGPITIVPSITLVGLYIYKMVVRFSETNWMIAAVTCVVNFIFSLFLAKKKTPIPAWTPKRGFFIFWYPFHQVFSILISLIVGWALSAIMTISGAITDDPTSKQYLARTDARSDVIAQSPWLIFPYPGQFGIPSFSSIGFISFFIATIFSVLDSIGDYNACARMSRVPPPPKYAFNRGIAVEGIMSMISGGMGCCHSTVSYGSSVGVMGITRVASRSVLQLCGLFYCCFAMFGKIGAFFITIPYAVLGGVQLIVVGIFIGVVLSYLQTINLNSTRNLAIIGIALLLGLMMPYWVENNPDAIRTGTPDLDNILRMLVSNPSCVGGVFACFMDNAVPGTLRERGLLSQLKEYYENDDSSEDGSQDRYEEGLEVYRMPYISDKFRRSKIARFLPIFERIKQGSKE